MRKYQMSIIFGVYDGTRSNEDSNELHVYADGNNIWGVISGGFNVLLTPWWKPGIISQSHSVVASMSGGNYGHY